MSNHMSWNAICSLLVTMACMVAGTANAAPTCRMQAKGSETLVTIGDTGVVFVGQPPPPGMTTYPGDRSGDISASCSDNASVCESATWFLRFPNSTGGWVSDNDLATDDRAVKCSYDQKERAQVCRFVVTDRMKTPAGKVKLHFSAKLPNGRVVVAYQPKIGDCRTEKDGQGNTHTVVSAGPSSRRGSVSTSQNSGLATTSDGLQGWPSPADL